MGIMNWLLGSREKYYVLPREGKKTGPYTVKQLKDIFGSEHKSKGLKIKRASGGPWVVWTDPQLGPEYCFDTSSKTKTNHKKKHLDTIALEERTNFDIIIRGRCSRDRTSVFEVISSALNEVLSKKCYKVVKGQRDEIEINISEDGNFFVHLPIISPTSVGYKMNQDAIDTLSRYGLQVK